MKSGLAQTLNNRWLAAGVHAGLWCLLFFSLTTLGGRAPNFREEQSFSVPPQVPAPVASLANLFSPAVWPKALSETNAPNPFFTRYFIPPQTPVPPPPTTRKIEVTYQGFYQTGDSPKLAVAKLGDLFIVAPIGGRVATNLFIAEATMQSLTLTNPAAQTNLLPLNVKKELEVPIP